MKKEVFIRRAVHASIAAAPVYYLVPEHLAFGVPRWILLILFLGGIVGFETYRHVKGFTIIGLRPHERQQIASFVWAAAGITLVLWVFPHDIASAALVGMAIVDPLAGEMRSRGIGDGGTVSASLAVYFGLCFAVLLVADSRPATESLLLCSVATVIAVGSERFKMRYIDDDFLMAVLPATSMAALALAV